MDLNVVAITGRLAADPEPYATGNGTDVTMLRLAVGRPKRRGQERAEADFVDVAVWDDLARLAVRYLAKGNRVGITGRLQQRTWTTPEGPRSRLQVVAGQLQFIDYKDRGEQPAPESTDTTSTTQATEPPAEPRQAPAEVVVNADGGARGNPGPAGYGAVVATPDGQLLAELAQPIGWATNNAAEYRAVIAGLEQARSLGARRVRVRLDSQLVIRQLTGAWQVKTAALQSLFAEARRLVDEFDQVDFEQVPREENRRADALANQAMNRQGQVEGPGQETAEEPADQHPPAADDSQATDTQATS
jgi:single stranded DNA-binding protein